MAFKMFYFLLLIFSLNLFIRFTNAVEVSQDKKSTSKQNHLEEPLLSEGSVTPDLPLCESGLSSNCPALAIILGRQYVKLARPILKNNGIFFKKQKSEKLVCTCPKKIIAKNDEFRGKEYKQQMLIPDPNQSDGERCLLNCQEEIVPFYRFKNDDCGEKDGKILEFGYKVKLNPSVIQKIVSMVWMPAKEWKTHFLRLLTICYRFSDKKIIFIRHKIRSFDFLPNADPRPASITYKQIYGDVQAVYKEENQKQVFEQTFPENHAEYFVGPHDESSSESDRKYFVMRQLVDDADMVLTNWKKSTYFYANTIPVWNTVEYLLDLVNDHIRDLSVKVKEELIIYSGTYGYLKKAEKLITLADQNSDSKLSVPALIWKVVYLKKCTIGIAVVIHNDISPPKNDFCRRIRIADVQKINFENFQTSSYHYFCHLDEALKEKIQLKNLDTSNQTINDNDLNRINELIIDEKWKNKFCDGDEETNEEFYMDEKVEDRSSEMSEDDESSDEGSSYSSSETEDDDELSAERPTQ